MPKALFDTRPLANVRIRGRSFNALVVTPTFPMASWFAALDEQVQATDIFVDRPVVADLSVTLAAGGPEGVLIVLEGLEARDLRLIAVEGVDPGVLAGTRWERLAKTISGRDLARDLSVEAAQSPPARRADVPAPSPPAPSLIVDRPVRSGQSLVFEQGDVTVIGAVASGAEVVAGGSIHVYGVLRGRAIAGLRTGDAARIFCRKLEAELVGVSRLYRTAENWGAALHGRAAQVWCDRGALRLSALD